VYERLHSSSSLRQRHDQHEHVYDDHHDDHHYLDDDYLRALYGLSDCDLVRRTMVHQVEQLHE
jgi:hypothetical protein